MNLLDVVGHYWPNIVMQEGLGGHCRARQKLIEDTLPQEDWPAMRVKFEKELAFGQNYQEAYRVYEAHRIAEGMRTDDPHFYDAFDAKHGSIATPVSDQEKAFGKYFRYQQGSMLPASLLYAGVFAFMTAALMWLLSDKKVSV